MNKEVESPPTGRFPWWQAAANTGAFFAQLAAAFVIAPMLLRHFGPDRYGAWSLVESILAYLTLFDLGISATIVRNVARGHATQDHSLLSRLTAACALVFTVAGLIVTGVGATVLALVLHTHDKVPGPMKSEVWSMSLVLLGTLSVQLPLSIFPAALDGLGRFAQKALIRTGFLMMRLVGVAWLVRFEGSLVTLAWVFSLTTLGESLTMAWITRRHLPSLTLAPWHADREALRQVRGYSGDALLAMIAGRISFKTDAIVIGLCGQLNLIPFFDMPARLAEYAKNLIRSATTTLTPTFSALDAKGYQNRMRELFLAGSRYTAYLALPIQAGLFLFGGGFLELWLGDPEYRRRGAPVLWILAGTVSIGMLQSVAARVLYGVGKIRGFARLMCLEALINLSLSLLLFPVWDIRGVALGTMIPNVLMSAWIVIRVCQHLDIRDSDYVRTALLRPILATIIVTVCWTYLRTLWPTHTWAGLIQIISRGMVVYLLVSLGLEMIPGRQLFRRLARPRSLPLSHVTPE